VRKQIEGRLRELKPLVEEFQQLEALVKSFDGRGSSAPTTRRRGRPAGSTTRSTTRTRATRSRTTTRRRAASTPTTGARRGRRRGSGTRGAQAEQLVRERPGITIPELADAMGIKQNYLYRVMPSLEADRKVTKQGKGWYPAG
jgi:hypothetical protein